ncbi:MAG: DUF1488 domain-containing protein [Candidatus Thiodiazotropha sp. (ex Lucinoma borealis)]|nr:DUF1488 domain-containing protein [Candidatus Thiodiazotropha sp. (ex Lucinoma borealis)]
MIEYPNIEAWDGSRDVVMFPANLDGKRIQCGISWEALTDNYCGNDVSAIDCFKANRGVIETKATQLIERQRFEPDGSVLILSADGP